MGSSIAAASSFQVMKWGIRMDHAGLIKYSVKPDQIANISKVPIFDSGKVLLGVGALSNQNLDLFSLEMCGNTEKKVCFCSDFKLQMLTCTIIVELLLRFNYLLNR